MLGWRFARRTKLTEVYFVRHAESDYRSIDEKSRPLTKKGEADLSKLVTLFQHVDITSIYSSPYKRAIQTVMPVANSKSLDIIIREDFKERISRSEWIDNEMNLGTFVKRMWQNPNVGVDGGESIKEVQERNIKELKNVLRDNGNQKVIIGTHGTALASIIHYYKNDFTSNDFMKFISKMPYVVKMIANNDEFITMEEIEIE